MYIETLEIVNLRCFKKTQLKLRYPNEPDRAKLEFPNVNLLLGGNGAGKTTVLKALALTILAPVIGDSGFLSYYLVRRGSKQNKASMEATAILHAQDFKTKWAREEKNPRPARIGAWIYRRGDYESVISRKMSGRTAAGISELYLEHSPAFFVTGYGATRRVEDVGRYSHSETEKQRTARYQRVAGLFESQVPLVPLSTWLPQMDTNKGRSSQIRRLLNNLLPNEARFTGKMVDRDYVFSVLGQQVPFRALSDGYRAYIGWVCDLLYHIAMTCPRGKKLVDNRGLVLIDEIDLHIHPKWQRTIISQVSKTLPNIQFVFTTHSPIVAASLHRENIFVMEVDEAGSSNITQFKEQIFGLSADQTLESPYFGMPTTRSPEFVEEIRKLTAQTNPLDPAYALQIMERISGTKDIKSVVPSVATVHSRQIDPKTKTVLHTKI